MSWPDHANVSSDAMPSAGESIAVPAPVYPPAPTLLRPIAGGTGLGAAYSIDPAQLDASVQSDPGSAAGWHRIERTGSWHAIIGGPISLRSNDLLFIQRQSFARLTLAMPTSQPASDVWLAVAWQLSNSASGAVYTLGQGSFTSASWRARRTLFLNNVNTQGGDFYLDTTGSITGAAYDSWADPELGDGCTIKLGTMTGVGVFDRIRLWLRGGCYNSAVGPLLKDLHYPPSGFPVPGTRLFHLPAIDPLKGSQCE